MESIHASMLILYGTTSGNSELVAGELAERFDKNGISYRLSDTSDFDPKLLNEIETLLLLMSTDGDGDPPLMSEDLYQYLEEKQNADLDHLRYSVLALGDSDYDHFCRAGKDFDRMLERLGAQRIADRIDCDDHYWQDFDYWLKDVLQAIGDEAKTHSLKT